MATCPGSPPLPRQTIRPLRSEGAPPADAVGDAEGLRQRRDEYSARAVSSKGFASGGRTRRPGSARANACARASRGDPQLSRSALPPSDEPGASDPRGRRDRHSWRFGITTCTADDRPSKRSSPCQARTIVSCTASRRQMPIPASGSSGQSAVRDEASSWVASTCMSIVISPARKRGQSGSAPARSGLLPNRAGSRLLYGGFQTVEALPEIAAVPSPVWQGLFGARCAPGPLRGLCRAHSRATSRLAVNRTRGGSRGRRNDEAIGVLLLCLCLLGAAGCGDDEPTNASIYQS